MNERLPLATKDGRANLIRAFKANGCAKCGRRYPELDWSELHVDHVDPRDKPVEPGHLRRNSRQGLPRQAVEAILVELLLCQVLCHDHHREKHGGGSNAPIEGQLSMFNGTGGWRYE